MAKTGTKTHFKVRNKITGYIYKLSKSDVDELIINSPFDFEVIDKDYAAPVQEPEEKTVYAQIVEEIKPEETNTAAPVQENAEKAE